MERVTDRILSTSYHLLGEGLEEVSPPGVVEVGRLVTVPVEPGCGPRRLSTGPVPDHPTRPTETETSLEEGLGRRTRVPPTVPGEGPSRPRRRRCRSNHLPPPPTPGPPGVVTVGERGGCRRGR